MPIPRVSIKAVLGVRKVPSALSGKQSVSRFNSRPGSLPGTPAWHATRRGRRGRSPPGSRRSRAPSRAAKACRAREQSAGKGGRRSALLRRTGGGSQGRGDGSFQAPYGYPREPARGPHPVTAAGYEQHRAACFLNRDGRPVRRAGVVHTVDACRQGGEGLPGEATRHRAEDESGGILSLGIRERLPIERPGGIHPAVAAACREKGRVKLE